MIFKFPDSDVKKIMIENWTDEPLENLLDYISTSIKIKKSKYNSNKILGLGFEKFMVQYQKMKNFDKWIIRKNL